MYRYGIIGDGRLAKHMQHYFKLKNINALTWNRKQHHIEQLYDLIKLSDIILLLIKDSEIEKFAIDHLLSSDKIIIHCSGSLYMENIIGMHPLMSFSDKLFENDLYEKISFIIDKKNFNFQFCFPFFNNSSYYIDKSNKSYYHALCVLSGNFSNILWAKLINELEKMNIPKSVAHSYLESISYNLNNDIINSLTGPLARGDQQTISSNLKSLENDPFKRIYQAFIILFGELNK